MSIIIQFNSSSFIPSASVVPSVNQCHSKISRRFGMVPGNDHFNIPVMNEDDSLHKTTTSNSLFATSLKEVKSFCFGLPYQDHNYGAPPPPTPPSYSPCPSPAPPVAVPDEDTNFSCVSVSTEEAKEESVTRCICGFDHDDEYMICCDNCLVWQHVDCMELDRKNMPDTYLCEKCEPRKLDRHKAKLLQSRKRLTLTAIKPPPVTSPLKHDSKASNANSQTPLKYPKKKAPDLTDAWTSNHNSDYPAAPIDNNYYDSTDSDETVNKIDDIKPKTRNKRRRKSGHLEISKKRKPNSKHLRVKFSLRRSKLKKVKSKVRTNAADEEAQDAWEYNSTWRGENFENAMNNQYTPEVQHLARLISSQGYEKRFLDQLRTRQCEVQSNGTVNQLICICDLPRNQPIIECKGKYLLAAQFHDIHPLYNKRLYPFVLFYKLGKDEVCVDASFYGNDARFVRRSCKPNAEIRYMSYNGNLHLYLASTKVIFKDDEVTIPFPANESNSFKDIECACESDCCIFKPKKLNGDIDIQPERKKRNRQITFSADEDSTNSLASTSVSEKPRLQTERVKTSERLKAASERAKSHQDKPKVTNDKPKVPQEKAKVTANRLRGSSERVKVLAERSKVGNDKVKAVIEKTKVQPERVRFPSERLKNSTEKAKAPELTKTPEKIKTSPVKMETLDQISIVSTTLDSCIDAKVLSDDHESEDISVDKKKLTREERKIDAIMRAFDQMERAQKRKQQAQEKYKSLQPIKPVEKQENNDLENDEIHENEDSFKEEAPLNAAIDLDTKKEEIEEDILPPLTPKPKKGKRRRGSGTPSKRRTRTNSGSSEIALLEDILTPKPEVDSLQTILDSEPTVDTTVPPVSDAISSSAALSPIPSATPSSPVVMKTKRFLLHEWMHEKSESTQNPTTSSANMIHTEMKWNNSTESTTCYVQYIKNSPHSSGISAAHLRRNSASGQVQITQPLSGQGFAKKRWLRQAMHDCTDDQVSMDQISIENFENGCLSPNSHFDTDSPGPVEDLLTPLKKRRLMRESVESLSSPHSTDDTDTTVSSSCLCGAGTEPILDISDPDIPCSSKILMDIEITDKSQELENDKSQEPENVQTQESENDQTQEPESVQTQESENDRTQKPENDKTQEIDRVKTEDAGNDRIIETGKDRLWEPGSDETEGPENEKEKGNFIGSNSSDPVIDLGREDKVSDVKMKSSESKFDTSDTQDEKPSFSNCTKAESICEEVSIPSDGKAFDSPLDSGEIKTDDKATEGVNHSSLDDSTEKCVSSKNEVGSLLGLASPVQTIVDMEKNITCTDSSLSVDNAISSSPHSPSSCQEVTESKDSRTHELLGSSVVSPTQTEEKHKLAVEPHPMHSTHSETDKKTHNASGVLSESVSSSGSIVECDNTDSSHNLEESVSMQLSSEQHSSDETHPVKCASATQKRKVSLSEYRLRMRENPSRPPNGEPSKRNSLTPLTTATMIPDTSLEQLTLAPLPLFDTHLGSRMPPLKQQPLSETVIKKPLSEKDDVNNSGEYRENLNERLKREFGFDVSDGPPPKPQNSSKSKLRSNNLVSGTTSKFRHLPPPPPPPPRQPRPPHQTVAQVAQFTYPIHPYPPQQPQFIVPQGPPVASYMGVPPPPIPTPILPSSIHQIDPRSGIRPPMLPSNHHFTPPPHGGLMSRPDSQKYAQRYAAPPVQNAYPHIYPSGLYK